MQQMCSAAEDLLQTTQRIPAFAQKNSEIRSIFFTSQGTYLRKFASLKFLARKRSNELAQASPVTRTFGDLHEIPLPYRHHRRRFSF